MKKMLVFLFITACMVSLQVDKALGYYNIYELYATAKQEPFMFKKLSIYNEIVSMDENFLEARKERATILYYQGKYKEAIEDLSACINNGLTTSEVYLLRGKANLALKDYKRAIEDFSEVLKDNPSDRSALIDRAIAYFNLKEYASAVNDLTTLLKEPKNDKAYFQAHRVMGAILLAQGEEELAREHFARAGYMDGAGIVIGGYYGSGYNIKAMSFLGMVGLIVSCLALLFRVDIPKPKRRKEG